MFIDLARKGWALRCLREARTDMAIANKTSISAAAISRAISAMRKSQTAIYYSLGDPSYIGLRVYRAYKENEFLVDSLLRILVKLEKIIQTRGSSPDLITRDEILRDASFFIDLATDIVSAAIEKET